MNYDQFSKLKLQKVSPGYTFILLRNTIRSGSSKTPKVKDFQILLKPESEDPKIDRFYPTHEKH